MNTDEAKLKTHDILLLVLLVMLFVFGVASYFAAPKDPENAKVIVAALISAIGMVLSFKFGIHQATPPPLPPDTKQTTQTVTPPAVPEKDQTA